MTKRSSRANALIALLGDRPIAYHPKLVKPLGSPNAVIFVCQLLYWDGKGSTPGGWIYKTQQEWEEETGLTRTHQETVRRNLVDLGILEEKRIGTHGRMHYRLRFAALHKLLVETYGNVRIGFDDDHLDEGETVNAETPQTSMRKPCKHQCGNPANIECRNLANINAETPQSITETTSQSTRDGRTEGDPVACTEIWSQTRRELEMSMTRATFDTWIRPSRLVALDVEAGVAIVQARDKYTRDWLENRLDVVVRRTLAGVIGIPVDQLTVTYCVDEEALIEPEPPVPRSHLADKLVPTTTSLERECVTY